MRVIFLGRQNAARSQMAEAFLRKHAADRFEVHSAGLVAGRIHELTYRVMKEVGIDISNQRAKRAREFLGRFAFHYAISVCNSAVEDCPRIFPSSLEFLSWPFDDPTIGSPAETESLKRFRASRNAIEARILAWLQQVPWQPRGRTG